MRELTTDRLRLRAFTDADVDFVHELHTHPGIARFIPKQVATDRTAALAQTRRFQTLAEHPGGPGGGPPGGPLPLGQGSGENGPHVPHRCGPPPRT